MSAINSNNPSAGGHDSQRPQRVLVDGHGGDHAPAVVLDALHIALNRASVSTMQLGVVGRVEELRPLLAAKGLEERVELLPASEVISMCESPSVALRRKRDSSMHVGAKAVRDGEWDAFVSAGNTGALMAISKIFLKTLNGIDRPAIASMIPSGKGGSTLFLDVGANVDCTSDHLVQFAIMGSCYMQAAEGVASPRVGLLNIGSEEIKGTDVVKLTAAQLAESSLNFVGNVEGTDIFRDKVDVIVCDGFAGNIALKSMEGTAKFLADTMREELTADLVSKTGALLARKALRRFKERVNPAKYNGAPFLGLNGIVVKSHGSADAVGLANAINVACREVKADLLDRITASVQNWVES